MTELIVWMFFALVQVEGMQAYGFKDGLACHTKMEEVRQDTTADVLVMSDKCIEVKMVKP